jgi:hypothetical protein
MMVTLTPIKFSTGPKPTTLAPRLEADIKRRIRELESRHPPALTAGDRKELHKLKTLLHLAKQECAP